MVIILLAAILGAILYKIFKDAKEKETERGYIEARREMDLDRMADRAADEILARARSDRD